MTFVSFFFVDSLCPRPYRCRRSRRSSSSSSFPILKTETLATWQPPPKTGDIFPSLPMASSPNSLTKLSFPHIATHPFHKLSSFRSSICFFSTVSILVGRFEIDRTTLDKWTKESKDLLVHHSMDGKRISRADQWTLENHSSSSSSFPFSCVRVMSCGEREIDH